MIVRSEISFRRRVSRTEQRTQAEGSRAGQRFVNVRLSSLHRWPKQVFTLRTPSERNGDLSPTTASHLRLSERSFGCRVKGTDAKRTDTCLTITFVLASCVVSLLLLAPHSYD